VFDEAGSAKAGTNADEKTSAAPNAIANTIETDLLKVDILNSLLSLGYTRLSRQYVGSFYPSKRADQRLVKKRKIPVWAAGTPPPGQITRNELQQLSQPTHRIRGRFAKFRIIAD
jgi:hypothetical protein